jgi:hypothetical protein
VAVEEPLWMVPTPTDGVTAADGGGDGVAVVAPERGDGDGGTAGLVVEEPLPMVPPPRLTTDGTDPDEGGGGVAVVAAERDDGGVLEVGEVGCTAGVVADERVPVVPTPGEVTSGGVEDEDDDEAAGLGPPDEGGEVVGPAPEAASSCASARALARASAATSAMRSLVRNRSMVGTSRGTICPQAKHGHLASGFLHP